MLRTATPSGVRVLGNQDLTAAFALLADDPVRNVFVESRLRTAGMSRGLLGGLMLGFFRDGELRAMCHVGANLVPVMADEEALDGFAAELLARPRQTSTIVGPADQVSVLWDRLKSSWPETREERWNQPHLEIDMPSTITADPQVRLSELDDLDELFPACVAMYTEEVGVPPSEHGGDRYYRHRITQLVEQGFSLGRYDDAGRLTFKAEVACVSPAAAQIQGVFVPPEHRGRGISAPALAAVVEHTLLAIAPVVSLYVNDHNVHARAAYARVGFRQTDTFATLMF